MWVGLDDTDSPQGGCTTWVLTELLRELSDLDLIGWPRLVRLNPNVPFRTRGNAALAARFGHGSGPRRKVGEIRGAPVWSFSRGRALSPSERSGLPERLRGLLRRSARWGEPGVDPAWVISPRRLPPEMYWRAVREIVPLPGLRRRLHALPGVEWEAAGSGQGLVGASAALAWPRGRTTYELIAYREPGRWGTPRRIPPARARELDRACPGSFHNHDTRTRRALVFPHTPCPILFGVRGHEPAGLPPALGLLKGEEPERWTLFETNQASGDHLVDRSDGLWPRGSPGVVEGSVLEPPVDLPGGHVLLRVGWRERTLRAVGFEPSKTLPPFLRQLLPGDRVRLWGSRPFDDPEDPSVNLEGIRLLSARPRFMPRLPRRCPRCGAGLKSAGSGVGLRCRRCRIRLPPEALPGRWRSRRPLEGVVHPTPSARRHLAPLPGSRWP